MVRINLLPVKKIKKVLKARKEILAFLMALLMLLVVLLGVGFTRVLRIEELHATIKSLENEKNSYQSTINEIEQLKIDKAKLETKMAMIKKLNKGSRITVRILDEIAAVTPTNRLWLQSLVQTPNALQLTGTALDNETIAQFMKRVKDSPLFIDAELSNSSMVVVSGQKLKSFSLTCNIEPLKTDGSTAEEK